MSTQNQNTIATGAGTTGDALTPQSWSNDPSLLKLMAGLALIDSNKNANLVEAAKEASGDLLDQGRVPPATTPDTPLFVNSNSNGTSFYSVKNGWGIQKQGSKVHTFEYDVTATQGLVDRIFLNLGELETAVDTAYAAKEVKGSISELDKLPMKVNAANPDQKILDENRKKLVDSIDAKTAPARENLAHVIIAAYHYIVDAKADDLVSYVSLCNRALKTFSLDVKILIGPQSNMPGVALAMVVNMVATGSAKVVGRKAIKPFKRSTKVSPIVELTENYIGKVYAKLKPKVEFQAEMDEAQIYGGSWVVELTSKATNMDDFRALDYKKDIESTVQNALESDRSKIYEMFAGLRGGGEVPIERKNLVQAGVSLELAVQLEKQAKEEGKRPEDHTSKDIWKSLQDKLGQPAKQRQEMVDKITKAYEKASKEKKAAEKKKAAGEDAEKKNAAGEDADTDLKETTPVGMLNALADGAGIGLPDGAASALLGPGLGSISALAGPAGVAIEIGKVVQAIAEKNEQELKENIAETDKARENAITEAEKILESMRGSTEADLEKQQANLQSILSSVKKPANFGNSNLRGMALQNELDRMSTQFGDTRMETLMPYDSYQKLVAGANGGKALKSVALFSERDDPILTAPRSLLQIPSTVTMTSPDLPFRTSTYRTTSETEMNSFIKSTENSGLGTANKIKDRKSRSSQINANFALVAGIQTNTSAGISEEGKKNTSSTGMENSVEQSKLGTEAVVSEFTFVPMKSFTLEERGLRFTQFAFTKFQAVNTDLLAKKFLKTFGSHIPFGTQTMGGVFVRTMKITTTRATQVSELYNAAAAKLAGANLSAAVGKETAGVNVDVFGLGGGASKAVGSDSGKSFESNSDDSKSKGTGIQSGEQNAFFESNVICFGPKATTADGLYQQLMKNNATWTIIDRGDTKSYLPVWELAEFNYGTEQFQDQITMLRTTWERMALKNHRAQDVDLLSEVMDDDPKTKVIQIVANLAKCMIPRDDKKFDTELGKDFEDTLTKASKQSLAGDEKPKSLQDFISKGFEQKQNEKNPFTILETKDYEDADYIYSDLDLAELKGFQPSKEPAYNPYDKITKWIVARGKNTGDHLIEACISAENGNIEVFAELFEYYSGRNEDAAPPSLSNEKYQEQLYKEDRETGMICLHYVALYGDVALIKEVLAKYAKPNPETIVDFDGNSALKYMEGRPEIYFYAETLKPKPIVSTPEIPDANTSVPPLVKTVKEKIIDSFNVGKVKLTNELGAAKKAQAQKDSRRNYLAVTESTAHVDALNEMLGRIKKFDKSDQALIQYAMSEVEQRRKFAEDEESRFSGYIVRKDNGYVQYIHKEAKETFESIKKDIEII